MNKTIQQRLDFVVHDLKKILKLEDARFKELQHGKHEPPTPEELLAKRTRNKLQEIVQTLVALEIPEPWTVLPKEPQAEPPNGNSKSVKPVTKKKK